MPATVPQQPATGTLPPPRPLIDRLGLCPDGKVLVVMQEYGECRRLKAVSCSLLSQASDVELQRAVVHVVAARLGELTVLVAGFDTTLPEHITVNGSGTVQIGGPEGGNGLSGKKLLLNYCGPRVPIGGSAPSDKDFWKPDRTGAQLARQLALAVVRSEVAREATVHLTTFPGDEAPRFIRIATSEGELPNAPRWLDLIDCRFSLSADWPRDMDLVDGARWGWFGRQAPWEALALR